MSGSLIALSPVDQATEAVDALPRLVHRDRRRALTGADVEPGRYLVVDHGENAALLPLTEPTLHVGRGITGLTLDDPGVSRRHAIFVQRPGGVRVLDDRSTNGTFVNGQRVTEHDLEDGDVVVIGRVVLTYREIT